MAVHDMVPRSLSLAPIESAYAISYWSSVVTLVLSCRVSEVLQVVLLKTATHTYSNFHPNFGVFPLDYITDVGDPRS